MRGLEATRFDQGEFPARSPKWGHRPMHRVVLKVRPRFTDPWDAPEATEGVPDSAAGLGLDALHNVRQDAACVIGAIWARERT